MEQLSIHTIPISRIGELHAFELPLLNNAIRITGLWYKVRLLDNARRNRIVTYYKPHSTFQPPVIIGQLSLCSNTAEEVSFYGNLQLDNPNTGMLDYTDRYFPVTPATHSKPKEHLKVNIEATTSYISGFIQDRWGVISGRNVRYEIDLYLYQEIKPSKKHCK